MKSRILLWVILAIAGFLRLYRFTSVPPGLYRDEAMNGNNALEALETGRFQVFYPENNGREGLYINVAAGFIRVFGNQVWALRLPAAIFGILTVWGLYLLAAELFSAEVALAAAFFLATSFWHILFSRMAFRAIGAPLFLTWTLVLLSRRRALWWWALAGVVYGLGFYTYIAYRATPLLVALFLLPLARRHGRGIAVFAVLSAAVTAPLLLYFAAHPGTLFGRTSQVAVWRSGHPAWEVVLNAWRTGRMFFTHGDYNWRHNVAWRAELFWPVAILMVIGTVLALRCRGRYLLPPAWLAVTAVPVVLTNDSVPHALRSLLMVPAACLLAGIGAAWVYEKFAALLPRTPVRAAAAILLVALCYEAFHTCFDVWAPNPNVAIAMEAASLAVAGEINRLPPGAPKYVVASDPMAAQSVMYLTGSYTPAGQSRTNIHYLTAATCSAVSPPGKLFFVGPVPGLPSQPCPP